MAAASRLSMMSIPLAIIVSACATQSHEKECELASVESAKLAVNIESFVSSQPDMPIDPKCAKFDRFADSSKYGCVVWESFDTPKGCPLYLGSSLGLIYDPDTLIPIEWITDGLQ